MPVYVDDMHRYPVGQFRSMKMSHLIADTTDELLEMVREIGVNPKWIQQAGTNQEHFDIALSKRVKAVAAGAVEITYRQCSAMCARRGVLGSLGAPERAEAWFAIHCRARRLM